MGTPPLNLDDDPLAEFEAPVEESLELDEEYVDDEPEEETDPEFFRGLK